MNYPKCKVKVWDDKVCDVLSTDGDYVVVSTLLVGNEQPSKFELHIDQIEMISTTEGDRMNFQTWAREVANARLSDEQLAMIRKTATQIAEDDKHSPVATTLLKVLNHLNVVMADHAMIDVLALQERLADRETRLKAMERAFFEKVVEVDRLKEKLESLEVKV